MEYVLIFVVSVYHKWFLSKICTIACFWLKIFVYLERATMGDFTMKTTLQKKYSILVSTALLIHGSKVSWAFERIVGFAFLVLRKQTFFRIYSLNPCNLPKSNCLKILSHEKTLFIPRMQSCCAKHYQKIGYFGFCFDAAFSFFCPKPGYSNFWLYA